MKSIAGLLCFVYFLLPGQIPEAAEIGPIKGLVQRLDLRKNKWERSLKGIQYLKMIGSEQAETPEQNLFLKTKSTLELQQIVKLLCGVFLVTPKSKIWMLI